MNCSNCTHRGFREMISKPYGYVGDIPCLRCKWLNNNDEYVPINEEITNDTKNRT